MSFAASIAMLTNVVTRLGFFPSSFSSGSIKHHIARGQRKRFAFGPRCANVAYVAVQRVYTRIKVVSEPFGEARRLRTRSGRHGSNTRYPRQATKMLLGFRSVALSLTHLAGRRAATDTAR